MRPKPRITSFDAPLEAIAVAPSAADLALLLLTAQTYFTGTQREDIEAAVAKREAELPNGSHPDDPLPRDFAGFVRSGIEWKTQTGRPRPRAASRSAEKYTAPASR